MAASFICCFQQQTRTKMAHSGVLFLCLLISGLSIATNAAPAGNEHASCQIWDRLAKQLTKSTGAQQVCTSSGSDPCTRIDCNGAYQYNTGNAGSLFSLPGGSMEVDYCFGVILNHCDQNISLDFYMQVPDRQVNQSTRIYHNTLLSIPGLSYTSNSSGGIAAQGYLYFQMERNGDTVTFSVTVKVRMRFAGLTYWPNELQRRLIKNETVPVPPCQPGANSSSAIPSIAQCKPPHWKDDQPATDQPPFNPPGHSGANIPADLGKLCTETEFCSRDPWLACDEHQQRCVCAPNFEQVAYTRTGGSMCRPRIRHGKLCRSDDECSLAMSENCFLGRCRCQQDSVFNNQTQMCEPKQTGQGPGSRLSHPTAVPHLVTQPNKSKGEVSGQNKAAIIAGAVVGGLVVLGGILLVAYFAIRRLHRPYHNRELLLEGEDSDGVM